MHTNAQQNKSRRKKYWLIPLAVIFLFLLFFEIKYNNHFTFYQKWIECGSKPLATSGVGFLGEGAVYYYEPPAFSIISPADYAGYYCTPLEAEQDGISANSDRYEFPHLEKLRK